MKFTKLSLIAVVAVSVMSTVSVAGELGISANASATNNYVWRGMTQTSNNAAVQGGIDLEMDGFYLGTWVSNVTDDTEVDGYAGYAGKIEGLEYDLGFIRYGYLDASEGNFNEAYFGLSKDFGTMSLGATYSKGLGEWSDGSDVTDDIAVEASLSLPQDYSLDLGWGDYDKVGSRYSAGVSKSFDKIDFSIAYHNFSPDASGVEDQKNVVVSVGTGF
jgi:uncharacterized protein (TIGR02001 family)